MHGKGAHAPRKVVVIDLDVFLNIYLGCLGAQTKQKGLAVELTPWLFGRARRESNPRPLASETNTLSS